MRKALLCASAAAAFVSAGATAHAQEGWYGAARVGAIVDGKVDIDAPHNVNGALEDRANMPTDLTYGLGLGYGFANGFRLEGGAQYLNTDLDVADSFVGTRPRGGSGQMVREARASLHSWSTRSRTSTPAAT